MGWGEAGLSHPTVLVILEACPAEYPSASLSPTKVVPLQVRRPLGPDAGGSGMGWACLEFSLPTLPSSSAQDPAEGSSLGFYSNVDVHNDAVSL